MGISNTVPLMFVIYAQTSNIKVGLKLQTAVIKCESANRLWAFKREKLQ